LSIFSSIETEKGAPVPKAVLSQMTGLVDPLSFGNSQSAANKYRSSLKTLKDRQLEFPTNCLLHQRPFSLKTYEKYSFSKLIFNIIYI
jgi:hypothetical protein